MALLKPVFDLLLVFVVASVFGLLATISLFVNLIRKGPRRVFNVRSRNVRPDVLQGNQYGVHECIRLQNCRVKLHCVVSGPADKPLMLFVHGFPEFWYSWRHQLKEFATGYRAVAVDLRGYGESDKPHCIGDYTVDSLAADIEQLISALGYEKCTLVGHDWGGAVSWAVAAIYPERVERLVICNCPHPTAFERHLKSSFGQLMKSWYMFVFQIPILPELMVRSDDLKMLQDALCGKGFGCKPGSFTNADIEAFKYTFATFGDLIGPINFYRAAYRYQSPRADVAFKRKISMPTLIIWGTRDAALESKLAELSSHFVEQCTVRYIEGASHWVQQDEPQQVNQLIRQFIADN